jgi:hypothetical protein
MAKADRLLEINSIKIILLLLLPVLIRSINYHATGDHFSFCLFKNITGRECYGCGLLRGISAAMHLDLRMMIRLNRLNPVTIPLIGYIYILELKARFLEARAAFRSRKDARNAFEPSSH